MLNGSCLYTCQAHKGVIRSDRCTWKSNEYAVDIFKPKDWVRSLERVLLARTESGSPLTLGDWHRDSDTLKRQSKHSCIGGEASKRMEKMQLIEQGETGRL